MENTLQHIFSSDYNQDAFFSGVLHYVFGEGNITRQEYPEEFITSDADRNLAENANILSIKKIGSIEGFFDDFSIFDIILGDNSKIAHSRVNIQKVLRKKLRGENSFLIFHYQNPEGKEWRLSYLYSYAKDSTDSKRYTYLLGCQHNARTATERFEKLKNDLVSLKEDTTKGKELLEEAFSVEALSNEFFDKYKALYANFVQYVTGNRVVKTGSKWEEKKMHDPNPTLYAAFGNDDKRIRDYVKKLMGRITFLYFVQKKGWFNGDQNYLQHLFETSQYKYDFLDRVLEPFFYTVLNTEQPNRKQAFDDHNRNLKSSEVEWDVNLLDQWNDIPFLNGGLFERDENDIVRSQFPSQFFKNENGYDENFVNKIPAKDKGYTWDNIPGIFDLFAQYNFTIDENDPNEAEVGIDPEMLGKIFENLLEDNKEKGAFYTPKEIVQYMCKESLIAYLQTDAKDDAHKQRLRDFVTKHDATILQDPAYVRQKIKDIKICDPAIGSGAFPMGMLNELVICTEALDNHIDKKVNRAEIKKHIIQNSIYGVDIERGAVDIARLRFWLSLVIDEEKAIPLPNLDYKIMQGNSLLEQYEGIDLSKLKQASPTIKEVKPHRNLFGEIEEQQLSITFNNNADNLSYALNQYYNCRQHEAKTRYKNLIENNIKKIIEYNFGVQIEIHQNTINLESALVEKNKNELTSIKATLDNNNSQLSVLSKKQNLTPNEKLQVTNLKKAIDNANKQYVGLNSSINESKKKINYATNEKQRYEKALDSIQQIDLSANQQFFLWHTWFADVFNRSSNQGFDVVIGNPPYVESRSNNFPEILKNDLQHKIKSKYSEKDHNAFSRGADLLIFFYEQGFELLNRKGINVFVTENAWLSTDYGKSFQQYLLENIKVLGIVDTDYKYFDNADINTIITFFKRKMDSENYAIPFFCCHDNIQIHPCDITKRENGNNAISVITFNSSEPILLDYKWGFLYDMNTELLKVLKEMTEKTNKSVSDCIEIGQGLNITKDYILTSKAANTSPYYISENGALYRWNTTKYFVHNSVAKSTRRKPMLILPRGIGTHFCCFNEIDGYSASYVEIYEKKKISDDDKLRIWLFCNSSLLWLLRECSGRTNLGGGMLKAEATDLKSLPLCFDFSDIEEIRNIYEDSKLVKLSTDINETLNSELHKRIDKIVFSYFGLSSDNIITDMLIKKIERRTNKRKNILKK